MPLTEIETQICQIVVCRLLDKHEATPRNDLLSKFKTSLFVPLQNLTDRFILYVPVTHVTGSEIYVPKTIAFHYAKDVAALSLARRSTELVLQAIRNLFDRKLETGRKEPFTPQDVLEETQKTDPSVSPDMVWLGLYLAEEFSIFMMTQRDANQIGITAFLPTEHVYDVVKSDNFWDKRIQERVGSIERGSAITPSVLEVPEREADEFTSHEPIEKRKTVFVIHGRDERLRASIFAFLRALHLDPLEWLKAIQLTEKASPYIGEILEVAFKKAQAVVVLLSPDDVAKLRAELLNPDDPPTERELTGQARPNVLFEAGMAFGSHGSRTVLVQFGQVRPFSDVAGRHILKLDNSVARRQEFAAKLKTAGCALDMDGVDWHTAGDLTPPSYPESRDSRRDRSAKGAKRPRQSQPSKPWDLWLGFDGAGQNAMLSLQNRGPETIFNVTVKIPEDGSSFESRPISRSEPGGLTYACPPGLYDKIRDAIALAIMSGRAKPEAESLPVRISFTDLRGSRVDFDELEVRLPFGASSFRRREQDKARDKVKHLLERLNRGEKLDSPVLERLSVSGYIEVCDVTSHDTLAGQKDLLFTIFTEKGKRLLGI